MSTADAMQDIENARQAALAAGIEPYAVLLDSDYTRVADHALLNEMAYVVIYDPLLPLQHNGVLWWSEKDYEKAEEAWMDACGL